MKVLNFGSLNIDHVYQVEHFVKPGETLSSIAYQKNAGGKGTNQSIALARAGAKVYHAGQIGEDGLFLKELLEKEGVDTKWLNVSADPTGHAIIQVEENGQNCILLYGGANTTVTADYMKRVFADFNAGDFVLFQNEVAGLADLIRLAKEVGLQIILNPSPINDELQQADLSAVDYFILNEIEGHCLTNKQEPARILEEMHRLYSSSRVVLTVGADGAYYTDGKNTLFQPAQKVKAVDTTAAGDTFTGYFFASVMAGKTPKEALELASAASAVTVTRAGAAESIPRFSEL